MDDDGYIAMMSDQPCPACGRLATVIAHRDRRIAKLRDRIAELEAIVEKLPKTADGIVCTPDTSVWHPSCPQEELTEFWETKGGVWMAQDEWSDHIGGLDHYAKPVSECYSTREAAEAAKEVTDDINTLGGDGCQD